MGRKKNRRTSIEITSAPARPGGATVFDPGAAARRPAPAAKPPVPGPVSAEPANPGVPAVPRAYERIGLRPAPAGIASEMPHEEVAAQDAARTDPRPPAVLASPGPAFAVQTEPAGRGASGRFAPSPRPWEGSSWSPAPLGTSEDGQIIVSAVLSIHNRSKLLRRALDGYMWQTMPPERWEIILVDDMSAEDLRAAYSHLEGRANVRHVRVDHTRHRVFKARNPGWRTGMPKDWYHTPAITTNVGIGRARGRVVCLCHPEILHAPENFERASAVLKRKNAFLFGTTYIGTREANALLDASPDWTSLGWRGFLDKVGAAAMRKLDGHPDFYWYTSFLPRAAAEAVGGVDFEFLNGVAGEDDDFRDRVGDAGWAPEHAPDIQGFHQNHEDETEPHRRRDTWQWKEALRRNRALYSSRLNGWNFPSPANAGVDWTAAECVVSEGGTRVAGPAAEG